MILTHAKEDSSAGKPFPKLMQSTVTDIIVLFYDDDEGIVLDSKNTTLRVGFPIKLLEIEYFNDFSGEITISNG